MHIGMLGGLGIPELAFIAALSFVVWFAIRLLSMK